MGHQMSFLFFSFFLSEGDNIELSDGMDFILGLCGVSPVWGILLIPNYCLQNKNFEGNPRVTRLVVGRVIVYSCFDN
jgi:hypothetical protein